MFLRAGLQGFWFFVQEVISRIILTLDSKQLQDLTPVLESWSQHAERLCQHEGWTWTKMALHSLAAVHPDRFRPPQISLVAKSN
jgi:hypothetical protein